MRGGRDDPQRRRQRRIVLRRKERGHEHQIRHAVADRVERAFGGVRENQLRADQVPDDSGEMGGLPAIGFDGENDGHPRYAA